jgi:hypothetical protein
LGAVAVAGYSSCWAWVPTSFGWQRVWVCSSDWGGSAWGPAWGSPWGY